MRDRYWIESDYRTNPMPATHGGKNSPAESAVWQWEVYLVVRDLVARRRLASVLDIGCGVGAKLQSLISTVAPDVVGVDVPVTIAACRSHDFGTWIEWDLECRPLELGRVFDAVLAADVIEHLSDPDVLLESVRRHCGTESVVVLSTPERDASCGVGSAGPPPNSDHIREWSFREFGEYVRSWGFSVERHFLVPCRTPAESQSKRAGWSPAHRRLWDIYTHRSFGRRGTTQVVIARWDGLA